MMRTHYCGEIDSKLVGRTLTLCGWAHRRRDHGGVIFIDLRDREGLAQVVCDPDRAETFKTVCAACHGADGKGNQALGAANLTDKVWLHGASEASIIETIGKGRTSMMPAHKELLGEARVKLLAAYVYGLGGGTPAGK
mgnify:CR=1 FL=1